MCKVICTVRAEAGISRNLPTQGCIQRAATLAGLTTTIPRLHHHLITVLEIDPYRRQNYDSGSDYVLEYGELRFTFNERDFCERVEQAAMKLKFIERRLAFEEVEDLVNLVVNGEVDDAVSALGHHINECWCELTGNDEGSLVHWLRRLVFRGAWLDQRVIEGELDIVFDEDSAEFLYAQPDRGYEPIILATGPSWRQVSYRQ